MIRTFLVAAALAAGAAQPAPQLANGPTVLILYDGPEKPSNPARIDALYTANLLGHFTTRRTLRTLEEYKEGDWKGYDAVFGIVYRKHYKVPDAFLRDAPRIDRPFCWLGNQHGQLDRYGALRRHGLAYVRFFENAPLSQVVYKGRTLDKGDPDTNIVRIVDPRQARVLAWAVGRTPLRVPYIVQSAHFWLVADSPFSYASEGDRYLAFADVLHDILGIDHAENHRAILRIEDINALSRPAQLAATLDVIRRRKIPFAFGFVPAYVNPIERLYLRLADKPEVVAELQKYVQQGGAPILHGYTHQRRGVSTDDYEFWDDFADRPVRDDSDAFVAHRLEHALRESALAGLYPIAWETPHYAASELDYRVIRRYFDTVFERRLVVNALGTDQLFPYPVVDLYGQYVIPENLSYVPLSNPTPDAILKAAEGAWVVRDGYASFFYHPFLKPELLDALIDGIERRGFRFFDVRLLPNMTHGAGEVVATRDGPAEVSGEGGYLLERVIGAAGAPSSPKVSKVAESGPIRREIELSPGQTYVALRQDTTPPSLLNRLVRLAKGDFTALQRRWESVLSGRIAQEPVQAVLLWNPKARGEQATDQESFRATLDSAGFPVEKLELARLAQEENDFGPFTLLVVPSASAKALSEEQTERITRTVKGGITLVTDGESPLSRALGVRLGEASAVNSLTSRVFANEEDRWADHPVVPWVAQPVVEDDSVYYSDRDLGHPLVIGGQLGQGRFLYFAPLYDPLTGGGYGRFPGLAYLLINDFHVRPMLKRRGADAYFDPGYRNNISIERLVPLWRRSGIRAVHAAAWHFYDKYSYDYARLIRVAHENGILVYAWLEWPHISEYFWNRHPEWREKTARLTDAHLDWRFLMNLQNPQCLTAALDDLKHFLLANDWDGVDVAELTFESQGPEHPESFTPFSAQARAGFQKQSGFDPIDLFDASSPHHWAKDRAGLSAFYDYRRSENRRLLRAILGAVDEASRGRGRPWETIVTLIDVLGHPELSDQLGVDGPRTIETLNRHQATLQVEDPARDWAKPPERYKELGERYRGLRLSRPFSIDINVVPVHPAGQVGFAAAQQTGSELLRLWQVAAGQTSRVCLYSESSVSEQDWDILPYAMAEKADVRKDGSAWVIRTPYTVSLELDDRASKHWLDGKPWPCSDNGEALIPPGEHRLTLAGSKRTWFDTSELETKLLSISGELLGAQQQGRGLEVEYSSPGRCAMMFSNAFSKILIDGQPALLPMLRGDSGYVVVAPPGQHRLTGIGEATFGYAVRLASLILASLIVLFGLASSGLLALLFVLTTLKRRLQALRRWLGKAAAR